MAAPPMWKLFDPDGPAQLANGPNVTELLNALNGRVIKDFPEPTATDATLGFDHPVAELSLYVGGVIPEEKKEEKKADSKDAKKDEAKDKEAKKDEAKDKEGKKD